jgi:hypothetical protein
MQLLSQKTPETSFANPHAPGTPPRVQWALGRKNLKSFVVSKRGWYFLLESQDGVGPVKYGADV